MPHASCHPRVTVDAPPRWPASCSSTRRTYWRGLGKCCARNRRSRTSGSSRDSSPWPPTTGCVSRKPRGPFSSGTRSLPHPSNTALVMALDGRRRGGLAGARLTGAGGWRCSCFCGSFRPSGRERREAVDLAGSGGRGGDGWGHEVKPSVIGMDSEGGVQGAALPPWEPMAGGASCHG